MAVYEYQAIARSGKTVKGLIDADNPAAARRKLREQELSPTDVAESFAKVADDDAGASRDWFSRVSLRDVAMMTRQLAVLLQAGMSLVEAMTALLDQTSNARLRKNIFDVRDQVNKGVTMADALASHPHAFSDLYVNMVRAGETSGALEQVLFRLADVLERQVKLKSKVTFALFYPASMATFMVGIITFMMLVIVPRFTQMYITRNRDLPLITKALIAACDIVSSWWWLIILVVIGLFALWRLWVGRPEGRRQWDTLRLRMPLFGPLHMKMICARLSRTLGTMLESGLTLMKALDVARSVVQNRVIELVLDDVKSGVRRGRDLAIPLKESGVFPPMLIHMVELGQRSGNLEPMLLRIADTYEEDVELTVDALVRLLEPLMIVVMGCLVGFLVIAILLPIFDISSTI